MQLDTEDGETFVPPAGVVASPTLEQPQSTNGRAGAQQEEEEGGGALGEAEQEAAV
jgi:sorting nexin-1/2